MKSLLILLLISGCCAEPVFAAVELNVSKGTFYTNSGLESVTVVDAIDDCLSLTYSVGRFGSYVNTTFIGAGLRVTMFDKLDVGVEGTVIDNVPEWALTGHFQFKVSFSLLLIKDENVALLITYTHFSNGNKFLPTKKGNNWGRDFVGLTFRF